MERAPFERVLGPEVGAAMRALHEARGVAFVMEATVARFNAAAGDARALGSVTLASGAVLPADLCIVGAGIIPAVDFLRGDACAAAGVELLAAAPGGVAVDARMRTGDAHIFAAGDVAAFPYSRPGAGRAPHRTRIEHWAVAYDLGRVAARNMLGGDEEYAGVPFFWHAAFGKTLRYAGHAHAWDRIIVHGTLSADAAFTVFYVAGAAVEAVATLGRDPQAAAAAELLRIGAMPAPAILAARDAFDLVECLREHNNAKAAAAAAGDATQQAPTPAARRRAARA